MFLIWRVPSSAHHSVLMHVYPIKSHTATCQQDIHQRIDNIQCFACKQEHMSPTSLNQLLSMRHSDNFFNWQHKNTGSSTTTMKLEARWSYAYENIRRDNQIICNLTIDMPDFSRSDGALQYSQARTSQATFFNWHIFSRDWETVSLMILYRTPHLTVSSTALTVSKLISSYFAVGSPAAADEPASPSNGLTIGVSWPSADAFSFEILCVARTFLVFRLWWTS